MMRNAMMAVALSSLLGAGVVCAQDAQEPKPTRFDAMVRVMDLEHGTVTVTKPGQVAEKAVSYKAYPYGTRFEVSDGAKFRMMFSDFTYAVIKGPAVFVPRASDEWRKIAVEVTRGDMNFFVEQHAQPGQFTLVTPLGTFTSLQGMSKLHVGDVAKGTVTEEDFSFRTLSGNAVYEGLHYKMTGMTQANAFVSADAKGMVSTELTGKLGEVKMEIPAGNGKATDFSLTPGATVKITRAKPKGSDNWVVSVLTLYANGEAKNYFCYVENRGEGYATGELIAEVLPEEKDPEASEDAATDETQDNAQGGAAAQPEENGGALPTIPDELESFGDDLL